MERWEALARLSDAPVTRLAIRSIPDAAGITGHCRRPARLPALHRGVLLIHLWIRCRAALSRCLASRQPAPGRRLSPPGGAPTPPVHRLTKPDARAPHRRRVRISRAARLRDRWPVLRPRFPARSIIRTSPV